MKNYKLTFFLFFLSSSLWAQTYQAPNINFESGKTPQVEVRPSNEDDWRSNYKIENEAQPQRELASEKEEWIDYSERESSRDPSSIAPKPLKPHQNPNVRPWRWSKE